MKIFVFSKRKYLLICIFILIFILLFIFHLLNKFNTVLVCNSNTSSEFTKKISNLTHGTEKIVYLTFDDGPTNSVTPKILDILKEENVKASFFVIGKSVKVYPDIVKRAYDEGHYIANHSYSHNNSVLYENPQTFIKEIKETDLEISNAIGIKNYCSHIFRFPNGFMASLHKKEKQKAVTLLSEMDYAYLDWNALNNDSMQKYTNKQLLDNLKHSCENKNTLVVLMHDTKDVNDSSQVLKASIEYLKEKGYKFQNFYNLF